MADLRARVRYDPSKALGATLAAARNAAKLSQTALGTALGCSQALVSRVETGEYPLDEDMLGLWATSCGTTVPVLLAGLGDVTESEHPTPFGAWLSDKRSRAGLTLQNVGDRVGLSRQAINGYETGHREPSLALYRQITQVLGLSDRETVDGLRLANGEPVHPVDRWLERLDPTTRAALAPHHIATLRDLLSEAP